MKINRKTIKANLSDLREKKREIGRYRGHGCAVEFYKSNGNKKRNIRKKIIEFIRHHERYHEICVNRGKELPI